METYADSTAYELRRSYRATKPITTLTYGDLKVQDVKNTACYYQKTVILSISIIDNIIHQGYEKRKQIHEKSFVETCTLS